MMTRLLISPSITTEISRIRKDPPHALLLHGDSGVGLATIAHHIGGTVALTLSPLDKKGEVDASNGSITVETIRSLYERTRGMGETMFVIIDDADRMTSSAQNALLKLLEEPPAHVHFVLTSHQPQALLPTVRSRTQQLYVPHISPQASQSLLEKLGVSESQMQQLLFIADGRPASLQRLTQSDTAMQSEVERIKDARDFLGAKSIYTRVCIALRYASSQTSALALIDSSLKIIDRTLKTTPQTDVARTADALLALRKAVLRNGNARLQLVSFVVK